MTTRDKKAVFEKDIDSKVYGSFRLTFAGVEGYDVYNCSVPFERNGKQYIYGRVEKRECWAKSVVMLFEQVGEDAYSLVPGHMIYPLEDPFVSRIQGEVVLGGTHVRKKCGKIDTYYDYFYRGTDIDSLDYFTTGPAGMKDIRLVDLRDGRIGVFSRPHTAEIRKKYGSAMIGFTTVSSLDELDDGVIQNAAPIMGIFDAGEWGGVNQTLLLQNGNIGIIGHMSYTEQTDKGNLSVYVNSAFEFCPATHTCSDSHIIGTRKCYPAGPAKKPNLVDCTFTSGIVLRADGRADLYGGIGDVGEGRIVIDYPFSSPVAD